MVRIFVLTTFFIPLHKFVLEKVSSDNARLGISWHERTNVVKPKWFNRFSFLLVFLFGRLLIWQYMTKCGRGQNANGKNTNRIEQNKLSAIKIGLLASIQNVEIKQN